MKKIGIIDIGSNSVRLVVVNINFKDDYEIIDEIKESVRLGNDCDELMNLSENKINTAISTLKIFKNVCDALEVEDIVAVATEAVRRAPNKDFFVQTVLVETGISVRVLTGEEEAYYDFLSVKSSIEESSGLIIDIGGCSTEFIHMEEKELVEKLSIPFGALNITEKFHTSNAITFEQKMELEAFLVDLFDTIPWLKTKKFKRLIGIGGSFRSLGNIHRNSFKMKKLKLHNYKMSNFDVICINKVVQNKSIEEKKALKGLSKDRADIFTASVTEISTLINYCNINEVIVSTHGLREGLIHEYMVQYFLN